MNDYQSYKQYGSTKASETVRKKSKAPSGKKVKSTNKVSKKKTETKQFDAQKSKQNKIREAQKRAKEKEFKANFKKQKIIEKQNKIIEKQNRKLQKQKKKELFQHALKSNKKILLGACFVVFYIMISMVLLYNNSNIAQLQYKANAIKRDIEKEKNYMNELEAERESTYKSETIENYAKYKLNMVYPSKEQIVYIKVD